MARRGPGRLEVPASLALPPADGFAIGNVAAFDMGNPEAVVSPGGVGFDINCGEAARPRVPCGSPAAAAQPALVAAVSAPTARLQPTSLCRHRRL